MATLKEVADLAGVAPMTVTTVKLRLSAIQRIKPYHISSLSITSAISANTFSRKQSALQQRFIQMRLNRLRS